jgi:phage-related tail protein
MDEELKRYLASIYTTLRHTQEMINTITFSVQAMRTASRDIPGFEKRYAAEYAALRQSEQAKAQVLVLAEIDSRIASLDPEGKR